LGPSFVPSSAGFRGSSSIRCPQVQVPCRAPARRLPHTVSGVLLPNPQDSLVVLAKGDAPTSGRDKKTTHKSKVRSFSVCFRLARCLHCSLAMNDRVGIRIRGWDQSARGGGGDADHGLDGRPGGAARALDGALFCAELMALCARTPDLERAQLVLRAVRVVRDGELRTRLTRAVSLPPFQREVGTLRSSDPLLMALATAVWAFVSAGHSVESAILVTVAAGGHSGQAGALVSGWLSVLHDQGRGLSDLPKEHAA